MRGNSELHFPLENIIILLRDQPQKDIPLYLSDVKERTCQRRIMENETSIFGALTVYHISKSRYVPGTELTTDDTVTDLNDMDSVMTQDKF